MDDVWNITSNIVLEKATLQLTIQHLTRDRNAVLAASGLLKIGNIALILVSLQFPTDSECIATIRAGPAGDLLRALTDLEISDVLPSGFPSGFDILTNSSLDLSFRSNPGGVRGWSVKSVKLSLHVNQEWNVGGLVIKNTHIDAYFEQLPSSEGWNKKVSITGEISIERANVSVRLTMDNWDLRMVISDITLSEAAYLTGSGPRNLALGAPELPQDTGVSEYKDKRSSATIIFHREELGYRPDSISVRVGTTPNFEWKLISPTLILTNLYAQLEISDISRSPTLEIRVHGDLLVQKSSSSSGSVAVDLIASEQNLKLFLDLRVEQLSPGEGDDNTRRLVGLGGCNVTDLLYMLTAGIVKLDLDVGPRLQTLSLELDWSQKKGSFTGTCGDWELSSIYPDIVAMLSPRIKVDQVRGKTPTGRLEGELVLLGQHVSMSYDLPRGPLRICGIDVREAVELAKKLYKLFKDVADAVETILKVVSNINKAIEVGKAVGEAVSKKGAMTFSSRVLHWSINLHSLGYPADDGE